MYGYIKGIVVQATAECVIVDNNQIGYQIISPNPYSYKTGDEVTIYTYLHVREDIFALYGFNDTDTLKLFKRLISVSGIGPKSALSIVASGQTNEVIYAIENSDAKYLTKFPGIGMKSAQQIILDLKGKLVEDDKIDVASSIINDVTLALGALGYNNNDIKKAIKNVNLEAGVEVAIKEALAWMLK